MVLRFIFCCLLFCCSLFSGCTRTVFKPYPVRVEITIPQKRPCQPPEFFLVGINVFAVSLEGAKNLLICNAAIKKYVEDLETLIKINNRVRQKTLDKTRSKIVE